MLSNFSPCTECTPCISMLSIECIGKHSCINRNTRIGKTRCRICYLTSHRVQRVPRALKPQSHSRQEGTGRGGGRHYKSQGTQIFHKKLSFHKNQVKDRCGKGIYEKCVVEALCSKCWAPNPGNFPIKQNPKDLVAWKIWMYIWGLEKFQFIRKLEKSKYMGGLKKFIFLRGSLKNLKMLESPKRNLSVMH